MKHKFLYIGIALCILLSTIFVGMYVIDTRRVTEIKINDAKTIQIDDKVNFVIDSANLRDNVYEIYGVVKNENLKYKYYNWVTGPGENIYKNYSLVLVDSNRYTVYKFKTYIKAYSSSNEKINRLSSEGNGFVAYIPKKYKKQNLKIAVLFKDRKNQMYLVYPEKEIQL